jgi:hypothetical protein
VLEGLGLIDLRNMAKELYVAEPDGDDDDEVKDLLASALLEEMGVVPIDRPFARRKKLAEEQARAVYDHKQNEFDGKRLMKPSEQISLSHHYSLLKAAPNGKTLTAEENRAREFENAMWQAGRPRQDYNNPRDQELARRRILNARRAMYFIDDTDPERPDDARQMSKAIETTAQQEAAVAEVAKAVQAALVLNKKKAAQLVAKQKQEKKEADAKKKEAARKVEAAVLEALENERKKEADTLWNALWKHADRISYVRSWNKMSVAERNGITRRPFNKTYDPSFKHTQALTTLLHHDRQLCNECPKTPKTPPPPPPTPLVTACHTRWALLGRRLFLRAKAQVLERAIQADIQKRRNTTHERLLRPSRGRTGFYDMQKRLKPASYEYHRVRDDYFYSKAQQDEDTRESIQRTIKAAALAAADGAAADAIMLNAMANVRLRKKAEADAAADAAAKAAAKSDEERRKAKAQEEAQGHMKLSERLKEREKLDLRRKIDDLKTEIRDDLQKVAYVAEVVTWPDGHRLHRPDHRARWTAVVVRESDRGL